MVVSSEWQSAANGSQQRMAVSSEWRSAANGGQQRMAVISEWQSAAIVVSSAGRRFDTGHPEDERGCAYIIIIVTIGCDCPPPLQSSAQLSWRQAVMFRWRGVGLRVIIAQHRFVSCPRAFYVTVCNRMKRHVTRDATVPTGMQHVAVYDGMYVVVYDSM